MSKWTPYLCLLFLAVSCSGQVAGRPSSGISTPQNYPYVDLSSQASAKSSLSISPSETERASRNDKPKSPPIYNENNPQTSGEIVFQSTVQYGKGYEPLQIAASNVVAIGTIQAATPHISSNRTAVYSTFTFVPMNVIKGSLPLNSPITIERKGGYVTFPSGKKRYIGVTGEGLPVPGYKYLVSLKASPSGDSYIILGGYALLGSHVMCLDRSGDSANNSSDETLINSVKSRIEG